MKRGAERYSKNKIISVGNRETAAQIRDFSLTSHPIDWRIFKKDYCWMKGPTISPWVEQATTKIDHLREILDIR